MTYIVLDAYDEKALAEKVAERLNMRGWKLQGGVSVSITCEPGYNRHEWHEASFTTIYAQAMVHEDL